MTNFKSPPLMQGKDGCIRKVGFELEFTGLDLDSTCKVVLDSLGGKTGTRTPAECAIEVEGLGTFNIELDWEYLKKKAAAEGKTGEQEWLELVSQAASLLVPMEVVCPPIPFDQLQALQPMVDALRDSGARGTSDSPLAAYGVHVNAESPALDSKTLFAFLQAFSLLQWWLVKAHDVDLTRKISPYIDLYPEAYLVQILARKDPTMEQVFEDYLQHNASRNRALDMLPLLAELDEERVRRAVDDSKIKARPAFHYRMADCHIEAPGWSLADAWNIWWTVETLTNEKHSLEELAAAFLDARRPLIGVNREEWVQFMDQWLSDHELV